MPPGALERCVGDAAAFLAGPWTRAPHLVRSADPGAFADLLTVADVDRIITASGVRTPAVRLIERGVPVPPSRYVRTARMGSRTVTDLVDPGRLLDLHASGATIVLQGLQRSSPGVQSFCRDLERTLTHAVQANAYLTPAGAQGLRVHHDTHDVFALQVSGRKRWVVHEPVVEDPLPGQAWAADEASTAPLLDVELTAGDVLYVPRGTPHAAATVDEPSLHLTIGVVQTTWHDLLQRLVDRARDDVRFRAALPAGWAADAGDGAAAAVGAGVLRDLAAWIAAHDIDVLLDEEARRFWGSRPAVLRGQLPLLHRLGGIADATLVEPRPLVAWRLERTDDAIVVVVADRRVSLPRRVEAAVRQLLEGGRIAVRDLSDHLDEPGRAVLVRRLVREGLLVVVDG